MPDSPTGRVRVFCASSLDGYIAGPGDDLSWLPEGGSDAPAPAGALTYDALMADVGALLMGRRTYDVVRAFPVPWPYGDRPFLCATHRPLDAGAPTSVRAISGPVESLVAAALDAAGGRDVYLDGGDLIRQACDAGLVDELTLTLVPVALGAGIPLFGALRSRFAMRIEGLHLYPGGLAQLRLVPRRA